MNWINEHRQNLSRVRTVVFDWDGTLADSIDTIISCMQLAAATVGLPLPARQPVRNIIGLGLAQAVEQLFPLATAHQQVLVVDAYRQHYLAPAHRDVTLFEGVRELLDELETAGYLLAVATGKSRRGLDRALAETGLGRYFVATRTVDECHSKPHPQMLHDIADHTGVPMSEMLMIGDGVMDIQMAVNAGAVALGVSTGAGSEQELLAEGALGCMDSVNQIVFLSESIKSA